MADPPRGADFERLFSRSRRSTKAMNADQSPLISMQRSWRRAELDAQGQPIPKPQRINDDPVAPVNSQFFPRVAVDQDTGFVGVSWYDTRVDTGVVNLTQVRLFATFRTQDDANGAPIFKANFPVTCGFSFGAPTGAGQSTLGDYIGLDFFKRAFFPAWGDNSAKDENGTDVFTKRVVVPKS